MGEDHIRQLEPAFTKLAQALAEIGDGGDIESLIAAIRHPGWTTPIDVLFVGGITESLTAQVRTVAALKRTLIEGSGMITAEAEAKSAAPVA